MGDSSRLSGTSRFDAASYTHPFATPPTTPFAIRSAFGVSACATSVAMVDATVPSLLLAAVTVTCRPTAGTDSVGKESMKAKRSRSCCVVLVKTLAARNSVRLTAPSWMKPKPFFCVGVPMFVALPLSKLGLMTSNPTFSYMLRRCGILKSWVSISRLPLKRFVEVPVGRAWQRLQENTPPSRFWLMKMLFPLTGLPLTSTPPPDWDGTWIAVGSVLSRLRNGLGGKFTVMIEAVYASMSAVDSPWQN